MKDPSSEKETYKNEALFRGEGGRVDVRFGVDSHFDSCVRRAVVVHCDDGYENGLNEAQWEELVVGGEGLRESSPEKIVAKFLCRVYVPHLLVKGKKEEESFTFANFQSFLRGLFRWEGRRGPKEHSIDIKESLDV